MPISSASVLVSVLVSRFLRLKRPRAWRSIPAAIGPGRGELAIGSSDSMSSAAAFLGGAEEPASGGGGGAEEGGVEGEAEGEPAALPRRSATLLAFWPTSNFFEESFEESQLGGRRKAVSEPPLPPLVAYSSTFRP